jgi:hypothetical protein
MDVATAVTYISISFSTEGGWIAAVGTARPVRVFFGLVSFEDPERPGSFAQELGSAPEAGSPSVRPPVGKEPETLETGPLCILCTETCAKPLTNSLLGPMFALPGTIARARSLELGRRLYA